MFLLGHARVTSPKHVFVVAHAYAGPRQPVALDARLDEWQELPHTVGARRVEADDPVATPGGRLSASWEGRRDQLRVLPARRINCDTDRQNPSPWALPHAREPVAGTHARNFRSALSAVHAASADAHVPEEQHHEEDDQDDPDNHVCAPSTVRTF
jgi:hypothetical protein